MGNKELENMIGKIKKDATEITKEVEETKNVGMLEKIRGLKKPVEPEPAAEPNPEEVTALQTALLQDNGKFRLEVVYQFQQLNNSMQELIKLIKGE